MAAPLRPVLKKDKVSVKFTIRGQGGSFPVAQWNTPSMTESIQVSPLLKKLTWHVSISLSLVGLAGDARAQATTTYEFSPVNQYGIELTASYWNPIIDYVSKRSGVNLHLKIGRTSADTTAFVLAGEVHFVFSNHLFSPDRERLGWVTFGRRDTPPIYSQIAVLADSPIQKLEDLAGQQVAFPGPEALVAYKFSYAELLKRNIPVKVDFGGNMDGAFAQLASGKAKAVGANSQLTAGWSQRENKPLRILWQSVPVPDLALMAAKTIPARVVESVSHAFTQMDQDPEGKKILVAASAVIKLPQPTRFVPSNGSEYAVYRDFYRTAPVGLR